MRLFAYFLAGVSVFFAPLCAIASNCYVNTYTPVVSPVIVGIPISPFYTYSIGLSPDEQAALIADALSKRLQTQPQPQLQEPDRDAFRMFSGRGLDGKVLAIFNTNCVRCHKPGSAKPGMQLLTADRQLARLDKAAVYESIESGSMPKGGTLSKSDKAILLEWSKR